MQRPAVAEIPEIGIDDALGLFRLAQSFIRGRRIAIGKISFVFIPDRRQAVFDGFFIKFVLDIDIGQLNPDERIIGIDFNKTAIGVNGLRDGLLVVSVVIPFEKKLLFL